MGLALSPPIHIIQYYIVFGAGVHHLSLFIMSVSPSGCTMCCYLRGSRPLGAQVLAWNRLGTGWNRLGTGLEQAWNKDPRLGTRLEQAWSKLEQAWNKLGTMTPGLE